VCDYLGNGGTRVYEDDQCVPYAYGPGTWITYDDKVSLRKKVSVNANVVSRFMCVLFTPVLSTLNQNGIS